MERKLAQHRPKNKEEAKEEHDDNGRETLKEQEKVLSHRSLSYVARLRGDIVATSGSWLAT